MPEYALAVDIYGDWVHVQEYAAPKSIDPAKAQARLFDALAAILQTPGVAQERVVVKRRERQAGKKQYERQSSEGKFLEVGEGDVRLLVNLTDYLDTGLFLDHRPMRLRIQKEAAGKRFLNLFCYTATATVHAARAARAAPPASTCRRPTWTGRAATCRSTAFPTSSAWCTAT